MLGDRLCANCFDVSFLDWDNTRTDATSGSNSRSGTNVSEIEPSIRSGSESQGFLRLRLLFSRLTSWIVISLLSP